MGAALFVITRGGNDSGNSSTSPTITVTTTTITTTTSPPSTLSPTTIPTQCASSDIGATSTTTSVADTTTSGPAEASTTTGRAGDTTTSTTVPASTLGANSSVSTVGLDTVTFGLTVKQAELAAGTPMTPCEPVSNCYRVTPLDAPKGISFVVDAGTIERVDITEGPITTRSGLGVGTKESRIVELLGNKLDRKVNDDGSIDLIFVPTDPNDAEFRVIFTIRDGVVVTFRSGRVPLVLPAEACSS